ncbi:MAG: hypothetical protein Alpg2KO_07200 [Alphaproteobacteria bacterium]
MTTAATQIATAAQGTAGPQRSAAFGSGDAPSGDFLAMLMGALDTGVAPEEGLASLLGDSMGGELGGELAGQLPDGLLSALTTTDTSSFALKLAETEDLDPELASELTGLLPVQLPITPKLAQTQSPATAQSPADTPDLAAISGDAATADDAELPVQSRLSNLTGQEEALTDGSEITADDLPYDPSAQRRSADSSEQPRSTFAAQIFGQSAGNGGQGNAGLGGQGQGQQQQQAANGADMPDLTAAGIAENRADATRQMTFLDQLRAAQPQQGQPAPPPEEQVKLQINRAVETGQTRISMQLRPAELGRIDIRLHVGPDGMTTADIQADSAETLDILRRDHAGLEKAIGNAGLNSDGAILNFSLRNDGGQQNQQNNPFAAMADAQSEGSQGFEQDINGETAEQEQDRALNNDPNQLDLDLSVNADGTLASTGRVDISV